MYFNHCLWANLPQGRIPGNQIWRWSMRRRERFAVAGLVCLLIIFFMGSAVESGAQSNTPPPAKMSQAQGNAFISSRPLPSWGSITGSKDSAVNLTEGEIIYVRLGAGKEGKAGDRFTIVHAGKKMTHPVTDRKLGRAIMICGELTLLEAAGDVWVARISKSTRSIHIGDEIMPPAARLKQSPPRVLRRESRASSCRPWRKSRTSLKKRSSSSTGEARTGLSRAIFSGSISPAV